MAADICPPLRGLRQFLPGRRRSWALPFDSCGINCNQRRMRPARRLRALCSWPAVGRNAWSCGGVVNRLFLPFRRAQLCSLRDAVCTRHGFHVRRLLVGRRVAGAAFPARCSGRRGRACDCHVALVSVCARRASGHPDDDAHRESRSCVVNRARHAAACRVDCRRVRAWSVGGVRNRDCQASPVFLRVASRMDRSGSARMGTKQANFPACHRITAWVYVPWPRRGLLQAVRPARPIRVCWTRGFVDA